MIGNTEDVSWFGNPGIRVENWKELKSAYFETNNLKVVSYYVLLNHMSDIKHFPIVKCMNCTQYPVDTCVQICITLASNVRL